jgi:dynein heavy chain
MQHFLCVFLPAQVGWNFVMLDMNHHDYTNPPDEGIYIQGLFLEGCGWDPGYKQLCESRPKVCTRILLDKS